MSKQDSDLEDERDEKLIDENYTGEYVGERLDDGKRDGFGRSILPNRDQYEGEYRKGLRNGSGRYWFFKSNASYCGEWKKGLKDGTGKFSYPDGSSYCGAWKNGKKHGYGKYIYQNGDIYHGSWKEDIRHGVGTYISQESGVSFKATWIDGIPNGPIQICYPNYQYHGYWNKSHAAGKGVFTFGTKYMLPGHIELFKDPDYVESTHNLLDEKISSSQENVEEVNQTLTNVKFPKCLPHFIAHEITQYNYSHLPQHPIPPPESDSDISICTKSSSSAVDEVHLYQVQSPVLVAIDCNENEDEIDGEDEIICEGGE